MMSADGEGEEKLEGDFNLEITVDMALTAF